MKLYDVPRKTWVVVQANTDGPVASHNFAEKEEIFFDHLDGMYSFCKDKEGMVVHLPAWAEVEIVVDN